MSRTYEGVKFTPESNAVARLVGNMRRTVRDSDLDRATRLYVHINDLITNFPAVLVAAEKARAAGSSVRYIVAPGKALPWIPEHRTIGIRR